MLNQSGKLSVGLIFGGRSGEHEISLMSARSVLDALDPNKYLVIQIGITHEGIWLTGEKALDAMANNDLKGLAPVTLFPDPTRQGLYLIQASQSSQTIEHFADLDVVFPVLHGTFGEDGTLQGLLEMADLAYVGSGVLGSSLGMDKGVFKDVMRANDIPIVDSIVMTRSEIEEDPNRAIDRAMEFCQFPIFVKPANLGSSVGISKCVSKSDLLEGLLIAARYDRRVLVERGINAREIEVSILGNEKPKASIPGEIIPSREYYSYESKYVDGSSDLILPAPISPELTQRVQDLAIRAYLAVDCAGMARVDFLLDKSESDNKYIHGLYLNELNTIPGFTKISMYPKLWEASGLSYRNLVDRLIELALERKADRDRNERRYYAEG